MLNLQHLTLNTGDLTALPRVARAVTAKIAGIVRRGKGPLGPLLPHMSGWEVSIAASPGIGGAAYSINFGAAPIVECLLCWSAENAERIWHDAEALYLDLSDRHATLMAATAMPTRPAEIPWLAVVMLPTLGFLVSAGEAGKLPDVGELERIIAWAILDVHAPQLGRD